MTHSVKSFLEIQKDNGTICFLFFELIYYILY